MKQTVMVDVPIDFEVPIEIETFPLERNEHGEYICHVQVTTPDADEIRKALIEALQSQT